MKPDASAAECKSLFKPLYDTPRYQDTRTAVHKSYLRCGFCANVLWSSVAEDPLTSVSKRFIAELYPSWKVFRARVQITVVAKRELRKRRRGWLSSDSNAREPIDNEELARLLLEVHFSCRSIKPNLSSFFLLRKLSCESMRQPNCHPSPSVLSLPACMTFA